ncbi:MAG TPA: hypothetical protein VF551_08685, partial [Chthoniobacterales bacterium]
MNALSKRLLLAALGTAILPGISFALPPLLEARVSGVGWNSSLSNVSTASGGLVSRTGTASRSGSGISASGQGASTASFGVLRAQSAVEATSSYGATTTGGSGHNISSRAKFRDNRVTNVPGREGQQGYVTIKYLVTGSHSVAGPVK